MQFIKQLMDLLLQGISAIFHFVGAIWQWTIARVSEVPWDKLNQLSVLKILLLIAAGAGVIYLLYRAGRELLEAGEKLLSAFVTLLSVFVRTLPFILIAGAVAAGASWIVTHLNF